MMRLGIWQRLLFIGGLTLLLEACATVPGGHIPPSAFEFHEIVSEESQAAGGWKVAQVYILLSRISRHKPLQAWCDIEVGIPIRSSASPISTPIAQKKCSESADAASQLILRGNETISAAACHSFRIEMRRVLKEKSIMGVRVTKFMTPGIEPKSFPEE